MDEILGSRIQDRDGSDAVEVVMSVFFFVRGWENSSHGRGG